MSSCEHCSVQGPISLNKDAQYINISLLSLHVLGFVYYLLHCPLTIKQAIKDFFQGWIVCFCPSGFFALGITTIFITFAANYFHLRKSYQGENFSLCLDRAATVGAIISAICFLWAIWQIAIAVSQQTSYPHCCE